MLSNNQEFRIKVLEMIKNSFGSSYTQYRFNKASNFVTHEEFLNEESIKLIISLGEELKRIKELKNKTNDELKAMIEVWQSNYNNDLVTSVTLDQSNALYDKDKGIDAQNELKRRENEEYFNNNLKKA